ncbi:MAG: Gamma-glutamyl-hercynylcysteine sulfoxide hydrolase [Alphaproteobacteria bacterium MarineAlpha9_Bin4]|nr:class II glutamine amidotransferase [Pelagibacterales bacterium]PPR25605.1 MAG: Gamma-glutamyl-hercynylcysteine sulfoxide hydrolase [Alphaproteobacteria bacterium MarineAlpha9_Bin4]|tara:strand:+ start:1059 stop:1817 length:759 start_codon:yes stop_codon:yes gene_type:complete
MCRHLGYIGEKELLYNILFKKKHSLVNMAFNPKEMENAKLNADGFGIAWNSNSNFYLYKSVLPIWNDPNLDAVTKNLSSDIVLANVRSATISKDLSYSNTHPFIYKDLLFSHNGYIKNFHDSVKEKIIDLIDNKLLSEIKGNTDSEYIFFLFIHCYNQEKNISKAIYKTIDILRDICQEAMLNFLICTRGNNIKLYATKFSLEARCPSLYLLKDSSNNIYISSEKLDEKDWLKVKDYSLLECKMNSFKITNL